MRLCLESKRMYKDRTRALTHPTNSATRELHLAIGHSIKCHMSVGTLFFNFIGIQTNPISDLKAENIKCFTSDKF